MFQVFGIYNIVGTKGARKKYFPPLRFLIPQHAWVSKGKLGWFFAEKIPTNASLILLAGKLVIEFVNHCYLTRSNFPFAGNVSLRKELSP